MYALHGPHSSVDSILPSSTFTQVEGPIRGLPDEWAIDGTILSINTDLYFAYSGWPLNANGSDLK
jgi:hypothetical protein